MFDVYQYLYALRNRGAKLGIERMRRFAEALGNPQFDYPVIHVAGTNGKGSTCAMLESIFRHAGYRTGMFTSPHLVFLGERVQCNRVPLSLEQITEYSLELRAVAQQLAHVDDEGHPTFFEFMTAMAFVYFSRMKVDVGIFETGLGGRLDSTNVVDPLVAVITSIGLDHVEQLGNTIGLIAREKAGIIKPGKPVIIGDLPAAAEAVIRAIAQERGCPLMGLMDHYKHLAQGLPETNLEGAYQRLNAGMACMVAEWVSDDFPRLSTSIAAGLRSVQWAARWQSLQLTSGHSLILDTTHNEQGAIELQRNLQQLCDCVGHKPVILVGILGVERAESIMPVVVKYAAEILVLVPKQPRACSLVQLSNLIPDNFAGSVKEERVEHLFPRVGCCTLPLGKQLVATGSIYLMGEIMERITHGACVPDAMQDHI